jgi:serine O-acetyltransferase
MTTQATDDSASRPTPSAPTGGAGDKADEVPGEASAAGETAETAAAAVSPGFLEAVRGDFAMMAVMKGARYPSVAGVIDILGLPGTWAVLLFRISSALNRSGLTPLSRVVYFLNCVLFGADLAPTAVVQPGLVLPHPVGVAVSPGSIGRNVRLMGGVRVGGGAYDDQSRDGLPTIGDDCFILDGAKLFGPVVIGPNTVVGTNAVVTRDLPANVIAVGNPARVVRHRDPGDT